MKVRHINDVLGTDRDVSFKEGKSLRFVLERDSMGFSIHKTIIKKGEKGRWHYKNHLESCYCIEGVGELVNLETNEKFTIEKDTVYSLDNNDDHTFEALEDVVLISVFNPPVTGGEIHLEDGSYESNDNIFDLAKRIVIKISETTNDYDAIKETINLLTNKNK